MPPIIAATVEFIPANAGGRATAPKANGTYRPHLRLSADGELLGVCLVGGADLTIGAQAEVSLGFMYDGVDYSGLKPGASFEICEGSNVVGRGVVRSPATGGAGAV